MGLVSIGWRLDQRPGSPLRGRYRRCEAMFFSRGRSLKPRRWEKAQDALHYDTAYEVSAALVGWLVLDRDLEKAGEWSAYALLFGPLLSGGVGRWADWVVGVLRSVPEVQDRRRFLDAMQERCRSIEEENDVGGQLSRVVEMLRSRMG